MSRDLGLVAGRPSAHQEKRFGPTSPLHGYGRRQTVRVGPNRCQGSSTDIRELDAPIASDRNAEAQHPGEILLLVVLANSIHGRFLAQAIADTSAHPESRAEGVIKMCLEGVKRVLFQAVPIEELVVVRIDPGRCRQFSRPLSPAMHGPQLRSEGNSVAAKIEEFVLEIMPRRQLHDQTQPHDRLTIRGRPIFREFCAS